MAVESATYIAGLDPKWPLLDADISEGDDHIRLCKHVMVKTFPGVDGDGFKKAITATEDELNRMEGVTAPVQDQLDTLDAEKVGKTGDQTIDGGLEIDRALVLNAPPDHGYNGVNIRDVDTGEWGALFNLNTENKQIHIRQIGITDAGGSQPSLADPETILTLKEGQAVMGAFGQTDAIYPKALTTREFVEANFVANSRDQEIEGTLTVHEEVRVIADTQHTVDGFSIYTPDPGDNNAVKIRAAMYFIEEYGALAFAVADVSGVPQTEMIYYPEGELRIDGNVVLTTNNLTQLTAAPGGASGTFEDNTGKTVSVVNGLITDLG